MRIYAAYQHPDDSDASRLILVRQGFAFLALLFPILWLLYRRMWLIACAYLALYLLVVLWSPATSIGVFLLLASRLFLGFEGNSLYESSLLRRGYHLANILIANDAIEAESRFFASLNKTPAAAGTLASE